MKRPARAARTASPVFFVPAGQPDRVAGGGRAPSPAAASGSLAVKLVPIKHQHLLPGLLRLPDMLRKKSEIGKTIISKRHVFSHQKMKQAREFLRDYFEVMDVPTDEDGMIRFIVDRFTAQRQQLTELDARY